MLHEAELELDLEHPWLYTGDGGAVARRYAWRVRCLDRHDQRCLVQHLVVPQVVDQRRRSLAEVLEHEDSGARDALRVRFIEHFLEGPLAALDAFGHQLSTGAPGLHLHHQDHADGQREPATVWDLHDVGAEEAQLDREQWRADQERLRPRPLPSVGEHPEEDERGDGHRHRDGDAIGGRKVARRAEAEDQPHTRDHQQPVDEGHVDLPLLRLRGVEDLDARQVVEFHGLSRQ